MQEQNIIEYFNSLIKTNGKSARFSIQDSLGGLVYVSEMLANEFGCEDRDILVATNQKYEQSESTACIIYSIYSDRFYLRTSIFLYDPAGNLIGGQSLYCPVSHQVAQQFYQIRYFNSNLKDRGYPVMKPILRVCRLFAIESKESALIDCSLKHGYDKFIPNKLLQQKVIFIHEYCQSFDGAMV